MIPVENSIAGRVADVHHLLPSSGLKIIGERFKPIRFQLMANPGTRLEDVRTVVSMPIAARPVPQDPAPAGRARPSRPATPPAPPRPWPSIPIRTRAAIAPALAAETLRPGDPAARHRGRGPQHHPLPGDDRRSRSAAGRRPSAPCVTSFVFRVRNIPAALYKALGGFATNGVNMTKLESYMENGAFTATFFYAEVDGRPGGPGPGPRLRGAGLLQRPLRDPGRVPGRPLPRRSADYARACRRAQAPLRPRP